MAQPTLTVSIRRVSADGELEIRRITAVETTSIPRPAIDEMVLDISGTLYRSEFVQDVDVSKVVG